MSAVVTPNGKTRQLDRPAEPNESVAEEDIKSPTRVAELFLTLLRDVATLRRRWWPRRVDHRDVSVGNTGNVTPIRFPHGFNGRVNWWVVDWVPAATGNAPILENASSDGLTDYNTLVLYSSEEGTLTLRIEEAG